MTHPHWKLYNKLQQLFLTDLQDDDRMYDRWEGKGEYFLNIAEEIINSLRTKGLYDDLEAFEYYTDHIQIAIVSKTSGRIFTIVPAI